MDLVTGRGVVNAGATKIHGPFSQQWLEGSCSAQEYVPKPTLQLGWLRDRQVLTNIIWADTTWAEVECVEQVIKEYGEPSPHCLLLFASWKQIILSTWKRWSHKMESGCVNHHMEVADNQPKPLHWTVGEGVFVIVAGITVTHWLLSLSFLGSLIPLKLKYQVIL